MGLRDLAEEYRERSMDVVGVSDGNGRIDFAEEEPIEIGYSRWLGRMALDHGYVITGVEVQNPANPVYREDDCIGFTLWFDSIDGEVRTEAVEVEKEVLAIQHERGEAVIHE